jgi:UDP-glucose 4-epimerase
MKSVVLGGSGFIGSYLSKLLKMSGRDIVVIGTRTTSQMLNSAGVQYIANIPSEHARIEKELFCAEEIYDLSYVRQCTKVHTGPSHEALHNLGLSVRLLERLLKTGAKRVLVMSSGGSIYGQTLGAPVTEDFETNPVSPYGIAKLALEKYALMYCRQFDLPIIIARPSNAYGYGQQPHTGQGFIATAIANILNDSPVTIFGSSGTNRDYIHVSDVANGILAAMNSGEIGEIYNIGTGIGRNNIEVLEALKPFALMRGKEIEIKFAPTRLSDPSDNVLDATKLKECSLWKPITSFTSGLADAWDYIEHYRSRQ